MPVDKEQFDGVLGVSMDPASQVIQLEHQDSGKTFEFHVDDLDEVVATLIAFQAALKAGEVDGVELECAPRLPR